MTSLYQLETDFRTVNCGMCYVVRLEDGSLVVLDGGYFAPGQAEALHSFFESICPDGVRIRAWFFTHAHQDHIGAFINFVRLYPGSRIDCLYYAFQPMDFSNVTGDWKSSDEATFREFYIAVKELPASVRTHILKTNEHIVLNELDVEVLYTYADADETITNFNDNSAVLLFSCRGTRILFLGDAASVASKALLKAPEKLGCDVVQVAHHGFNGASEAVYRAANAHTALWPTPLYEMEGNRNRAANTYLLENCDTILAAKGTARLDLPFKKGSYTLFERIFPDRQFGEKA